MYAPVSRSTRHITPFQAATTNASSGEMVANPWPPVFAMDLTSGLGGASLVTSMIQRLPPEVAWTAPSMYLPSRETVWHATQPILSFGGYTVGMGLPTM
jgi:hypothetical protein